MLRVFALSAVALLAGCSSTGNPGLGAGGEAGIVASEATASNVARIGFLSDYARLRPMPGGGGMLCWRDAGAEWSRYDKLLIERIHVTLKPGSAQQAVDPTDLKTLLDDFHAALVKALGPQVQIVNAAGPGVLRVRIVITRLVPTKALDSLAGTVVPYGFVAEIGSGAATGRPAGSTPYLGETGMEAQFRDGASGAVIAECADDEIGRKYAADLDMGVPGAVAAWANGYVQSFTSWSYAQDAFSKWATAFAQRFAQLRGPTPGS